MALDSVQTDIIADLDKIVPRSCIIETEFRLNVCGVWNRRTGYSSREEGVKMKIAKGPAEPRAEAPPPVVRTHLPDLLTMPSSTPSASTHSVLM